ncbi:MAG: hypothetical protein FJW35_13445 [Acidobacteria bacterium]|nr:hypothetical protein [Acidobacteriota bacterium]
MSEAAHRPDPQDRGHEVRDIHAGKVALFGAALMLLLVVGAVVAWLTFTYFAGMPQEGEPLSPLHRPRELPPVPRLQVIPVKDLAEKRQAEDLRLGSYGWVDRDNGVVHIPIERAMDLVAAGQKE